MPVKKIICVLLVMPLFVVSSMTGKPLLLNNKMITVKKISFPCKTPPIALVEKMLDSCKVEFNQIDQLNWPDFPYKPDVKFRIAYSRDEIYLQYIVKERFIRAHFTDDTGSQPYKDSCVEFFIIPALDNIYYNLELNCIGTGTFAGGPDRKERTRFGSDVTKQIRRASSLGNNGFETKEGDFEWKITIAIPVSLFLLSNVPKLDGRTVKANFYKCGDDLPEKHFLSWNPILLEKPDFHAPAFFGDLYFQN